MLTEERKVDLNIILLLNISFIYYRLDFDSFVTRNMISFRPLIYYIFIKF